MSDGSQCGTCCCNCDRLRIRLGKMSCRHPSHAPGDGLESRSQQRIAVLSALAGWLVRPYEHVQAYQVSIIPPDGSAFGGSAISPDGKQLAFVVRKDGKAQLWVRQLDSPTARSLSGTEDASDPFWSPDSRYVGFFTREKLKRIEVAQGPPQTLCDAVSGRGGSWNARGDIVFAAFSTGRPCAALPPRAEPRLL